MQATELAEFAVGVDPRVWGGEGGEGEGRPEILAEVGRLGFLAEKGQLGECGGVVQVSGQAVDDLVCEDVVIEVDVLAVLER